jgi:hypothetical protein
MPQAMIMPYMRGKMVDWTHRVKPRLYRRPDRFAPNHRVAATLLFELVKLTQA